MFYSMSAFKYLMAHLITNGWREGLAEMTNLLVKVKILSLTEASIAPAVARILLEIAGSAGSVSAANLPLTNKNLSITAGQSVWKQ